MITHILYIFISHYLIFVKHIFSFNKKCWKTFISSIYPIFTFTVDYHSTIIRRFSVFYRIFHNNTLTCFIVPYLRHIVNLFFCHKNKKNRIYRNPIFFGVFNYAISSFNEISYYIMFIFYFIISVTYCQYFFG